MKLKGLHLQIQTAGANLFELNIKKIKHWRQ